MVPVAATAAVSSAAENWLWRLLRPVLTTAPSSMGQWGGLIGWVNRVC